MCWYDLQIYIYIYSYNNSNRTDVDVLINYEIQHDSILISCIEKHSHGCKLQRFYKQMWTHFLWMFSERMQTKNAIRFSKQIATHHNWMFCACLWIKIDIKAAHCENTMHLLPTTLPQFHPIFPQCIWQIVNRTAEVFDFLQFVRCIMGKIHQSKKIYYWFFSVHV